MKENVLQEMQGRVRTVGQSHLTHKCMNEWDSGLKSWVLRSLQSFMGTVLSILYPCCTQ